MSKRVNNKKGNRAKRKWAYNHRTKCRGGAHGDSFFTKAQRRKQQLLNMLQANNLNPHRVP